MRTALAFVLAAWVSASAADDLKPDFTLTAQQFGKEFQTDRKAFETKYKGKVVEVSGTVWNTRPPTGDVLLHGNKNKEAFIGEYVSCTPMAKLQEQLRGLARGQQVTVRGKTDGSLPSLGDCEFVKVGASTAIPTTVAALDAEFKKNRDAAEKKYDEKSVVVKVKVLDAKTEDKKVIWTVTDAAGKGTAKIKAWADPLLDDKFLKELEMVKAGDVIVLIAEAQPGGDSARLWDATVLKEPPAGVKLPGAKK
jgi:hypothetical protein